MHPVSFPETRQLILKKINGGRRKRSGGTELAIGHNVADLFDNFWSGNRDNPQLVQKVSPVRVPLCFCRLVSRLSSNSWGTRARRQLYFVASLEPVYQGNLDLVV